MLHFRGIEYWEAEPLSPIFMVNSCRIESNFDIIGRPLCKHKFESEPPTSKAPKSAQKLILSLIMIMIYNGRKYGG